jgi:peptide/nickel transport system permease protein
MTPLDPKPRKTIIPPFFRFLFRRFLFIGVSLLVITILLYGFAYLTPADQRASLYWPSRLDKISEASLKKLTERIIIDHHLNDPFPIQYGIWISYIVRGEWGYSPTLREEVLAALLRRSSASIEITIFSMLAFIPLGLYNGALAGWRHRAFSDTRFRIIAFLGTSLPIVIIGPILIAIFYIGLYWFQPERISTSLSTVVSSAAFKHVTGMLTIDGLLNGRLDVTLDALRHLVMPVFTLSLAHWATLGRITRATTIEEKQKDYIIAAKAHGIPQHSLLWRHTFRNVLAPSLTSSALSAASLFTGVIIVERTFNIKGISDMILSIGGIPDAPAVMGFAVYSVLMVLIIMLILDIAQAIIDPRVRMGV